MENKEINLQLSLALEEERGGKHKKAEERLKNILGFDPHHIEANHMLGILLLRQLKVSEAEAYINLTIKLAPSIKKYYASFIETLISTNFLSLALSKAKEFQNAFFGEDGPRQMLRLVEHGLVLDKLSLQGQLDLIREKSEEGSHAVVAEMGYVYLLRNNSVEIANLVSNAFLIMNRPDNAIKTLKKCLHAHPNDMSLLSNLGMILTETSEVSSAITLLRRALEIDPSSFEVNYNLGTALLKVGDLEIASRHLLTASDIRQNDPRPYHSLAMVDYKKNHGLAALERLEKCKSLVDESSDVGRAMLVGHSLLKQAKALDLISDLSRLEEVGKSKSGGNFPLLIDIEPSNELSNALRQQSLRPLSAAPDARYGNGTCSVGFDLFSCDNITIQKIGTQLIKKCEEILNGKILQYEAFVNIIGAGGGTTPHAHVGPQDISFNQSLHKYSLTYYVDVGDQSSSEPGVLKFYDPNSELLPHNGLCVIFPSTVKHSAVYNGKKERIMIGMNFYLL